MQRLRFFFTITTLLILLTVSIPAGLAQDPDPDGDGLTGGADNCPKEAGPRENGGCPVAAPPDEGPLPFIPDSDGDGVNDDVDLCLYDIGPAENNGCPLPVEDSQPEVELQPLPAIPPTGPCMVATQGYTPVNIRYMPWESSSALGAMDPFQLYPLNYLFDNPYDELWYGIPGGHVASWVTRTGGLCRGLPTYSFAEPKDDGPSLENAGDAEITLKLAIPFPLDPDDFVLEPAFEFPPGNWPFPDPPPNPIHEHILLARFGVGDTDPAAILIGLLLPAVQSAREAANTSGETQNVLFTVPGSLVGFNPQPEPPPVVIPGSLVGFNPQPEPPPGPYFQIMLHIEPNADEADIPVEIMAMNFEHQMIEGCDGSVMPTGEQACLYRSPTGDSALCMLGADGAAYCMYGLLLPAVQK